MMDAFRLMTPLFFLFALSCGQAPPVSYTRQMSLTVNDSLQDTHLASRQEHEALLLTRFNSLAELKEVVDIEYTTDEVMLNYKSGNREVSSVLRSGVSEDDFMRARRGGVWAKVQVALMTPYAVVNRNNLMVIENLGRRRPWDFGKGDVAFYDLAETMVKNILPEDLAAMPEKDTTEKGYLNTFNHITAQAIMTSIFSERLADFIADVHERHNMPELITGIFTEAQLTDMKDGPTDNYIDLINNEWGQELGKSLQSKYQLSTATIWTPQLMADYLNDIQGYYSWTFGIGFTPFRTTDEIVIRFAAKINLLLEKV